MNTTQIIHSKSENGFDFYSVKLDRNSSTQEEDGWLAVRKASKDSCEIHIKYRRLSDVLRARKACVDFLRKLGYRSIVTRTKCENYEEVYFIIKLGLIAVKAGQGNIYFWGEI